MAAMAEDPPKDTEFPLGFETMDGAFRGTCHLNDKALELWRGDNVHLRILWPSLHAADGGLFSPNRANKIALDVTPEGHRQPLLLKLYIDRLSHIEILVQFISQYTSVVLRRGVISTALHTPSLLPYYSHRLRRMLWAVKQSYNVVLKLALVFYLTNLFSYLPEPSLDDIYTLLRFFAQHVSDLSPQGKVAALFLSIPFAGTFLFCFLPGLVALLAARHFVTIFLSLAILQDVHHIIYLYKEVCRMLTYFRSLVAIQKKEKKFQ